MTGSPNAATQYVNQLAGKLLTGSTSDAYTVLINGILAGTAAALDGKTTVVFYAGSNDSGRNEDQANELVSVDSNAYT